MTPPSLRFTSCTRSALALAVLAAPFASLGCTRPSAPILAPSGGHTLVLDYAEFVRNVEPVLSGKGCDAGGDCHGGGIRGTFASV